MDAVELCLELHGNSDVTWNVMAIGMLCCILQLSSSQSTQGFWNLVFVTTALNVRSAVFHGELAFVLAGGSVLVSTPWKL